MGPRHLRTVQHGHFGPSIRLSAPWRPRQYCFQVRRPRLPGLLAEEPKRAQFITKTSPMGYNFAAVAMPMPGSLDFTDMRQHILAKGK